uniref:Caenorhabditis elegans ly-6-related family-containing protein n=1 Tax=Strongyloides venezuelensis TaxID=75913 RepID=A0A0K0F1H1_STRVS
MNIVSIVPKKNKEVVKRKMINKNEVKLKSVVMVDKTFVRLFYFFVIINAFPILSVNCIGCFVCSSFNKSNPLCEDSFNSTLVLSKSFYPFQQSINITKNTRHHSKFSGPIVDDINSGGNNEYDGKIANYHQHCWAFKKNRQGLFPADHCIKISGVQSDDPSISMIIRTCALDSGTLTSDTEIVRISHCGHFKYSGKQYSGCVSSCETDGCNIGSSIKNSLSMTLHITIFFGLVFYSFTYLS